MREKISTLQKVLKAYDKCVKTYEEHCNAVAEFNALCADEQYGQWREHLDMILQLPDIKETPNGESTDKTL